MSSSRFGKQQSILVAEAPTMRWNSGNSTSWFHSVKVEGNNQIIIKVKQMQISANV